MKKVIIAAALAASVSSALGAEIPAPSPPPTVSVEVTSADVQVIAAALNIAASTCAQEQTGCMVGINKAAILAKLAAASAKLK